MILLMDNLHIFKCKKCGKLDPVPEFIVNEQIGFLKLIKKKDTPKTECPYCGSTMEQLKI